MIRNLLSTLVLALVLVQVTGCASITSGKNQALTVQSTCGGAPLVDATCKLTNSKGNWVVNTPGSVTIHKAYGDLNIACRKDGLTSTSGTFESSATGGVWGNIIAGGVIGYAVDAGTGAGFDYPQSITVSFDPPCGSTDPQSAAVN